MFGPPPWAGALAIVLGNVIGGVVMALHAAQGPQMGVPQMLWTRVQFGTYGSLGIICPLYYALMRSKMSSSAALPAVARP